MLNSVLLLWLCFFYTPIFSQDVPPGTSTPLSPCAEALISLFTGTYPNAGLIINSMGKSLNDLGNYDDCLTLNNTRYCLLNTHLSAAKNNERALFPVKLGWCMPRVCDQESLSEILKSNVSDGGKSVALKIAVILGGSFQQTVGIYPITNPQLPDINPICRPFDAFSTGAIVTCCVLAIFSLLVVTATTVDYFLPSNPTADGSHPSTSKETTTKTSIALPPVTSSTNDDEDNNDDDSTVALTAMHKKDNITEIIKPPIDAREKFGVKLLLCFSFFRNMKSLNYPERYEETRFFNAIRVLSILYVVLGHTNSSMIDVPVMDILQLGTVVSQRFSFQFIMGGFFAVDSFFFLSGFFGCLALIDIILRKQKINWFLIYFHRWWRLTPLYFVMIWVWTYITPLFVEGPLNYSEKTFDLQCEKSWWHNILYINNFIPWEKNMGNECMGWGWYLANDMQLFAITPFLLLAYKKNKKLGIALMSILLLASYIVVILESKEPTYKMLSTEWGDIYVKPWSRTGPYFIGIALALLWKEKKIFKLPSFLKYVSYFVSLALIFTTVYGPYTNRNNEWGVTENVLYTTFSRSGFVLGLAILCYLMLSKNCYFLKLLLSFHIWTPLARLSFGVYMVHPVIQTAALCSTRHALNWDIWTIALNFPGFALLSFAASLVFWFIVEKPFTNLEKEIINNFLLNKNNNINDNNNNNDDDKDNDKDNNDNNDDDPTASASATATAAAATAATAADADPDVTDDAATSNGTCSIPDTPRKVDDIEVVM